MILPMSDQSDVFDIAIVGGGLTGGLAALAFARENFAVALVDAESPATARSAAFDGRTTAIAYASMRVFRRLGLWDRFSADAAPIRAIVTSDGKLGGPAGLGDISGARMRFDGAELGEGEPLGWIVENYVLRRAIQDALAQSPNVAAFAPARRISGETRAEDATIELGGDRTLRASLVIGADGRNSPLRDEAGIAASTWRYPQTAIVVSIGHERPHEDVAHELFLSAGPFAVLPLTDGPNVEGGIGPRSSIVWTERAEAAPAYLALDDARFLSALGERFGRRLGALSLASPRASHPLALTLAHRFIAPRLALVGDAAHAIHPIAGQGYNLGVKDVAALVDTVAAARFAGLDIGSLSALQDYERWRRFDSSALAFGTDALNRLFSNDIAPLRAARRFGLGVVDEMAPLRRFFMRQAGADLGRLPRLMQP
jgi:2-octaprenyl-6-methoxyphenol hydroxylase